MPSGKLLAALVPIAGGLASLAAQDSPTIRVTTRLVEVNVIVRSAGKPVDDLNKHDFVLLDKGKPVPIAAFALVDTRKAVEPEQRLPKGVYTNQTNRDGVALNTVTVVLFDGSNTALADQQFARQQIVKFLETLDRRDRVAVYALGSRIRVLHDFTTDFDQLQRTLARYRGENLGFLDASNPEPANTGVQELDRFLDEMNGRVADAFNINRARQTTAAMEAIARHLDGIPGRKNLVWVSGAFPLSIGFDPATFGDPARENRVFTAEIQRAAQALNNARVSVYPVDARGLMVAPGFSAAQSPPTMRGGSRMEMPTFVGRPEIDSMKLIAEQTGGRAFYNTNDISGAIRQAIEDSEVTYTLGFYPREMDGKFHDIKVQVSRKGVQLRHRKGYFASDEPVTPQRREDVIRNALNQPLDAAGIALAGSITPDAPEPGKWLVRIGVDPLKVSLRRKLIDGRWSGEFDFVLAQQAPDGKILKAVTDTVTISLSDEQLEKLRERVSREGFVLTRTLAPEPGCIQLRVVVFDRPSEQVGSLRIPAPVKPPAAAVRPEP